MREILFRGKCVFDNEWVEGFYYQAKLCSYDKELCHYITIPHPETDGRSSDHTIVRPETVGQFTGLTDKNGKKIFEGDIVNAVIVRDLGGGEETRREAGIIGYDKIGMIGLIARYAGTIPVWSDFFQELTLNGCINDFWFEVIGNIHDNPELIGGADNG